LIGLDKGVVLKFDQIGSTLEIAGMFNTYNGSYSNIVFYKDYMIISSGKGVRVSDIYDISDPGHIEVCEVIPYVGKLSVDQENGLLFIGNSNCKVFDINNINDQEIKYLATIKNTSPIVKLFTSQYQNKNYLWIVGETSVNLYSYDQD